MLALLPGLEHLRLTSGGSSEKEELAIPGTYLRHTWGLAGLQLAHKCKTWFPSCTCLSSQSISRVTHFSSCTSVLCTLKQPPEI